MDNLCNICELISCLPAPAPLPVPEFNVNFPEGPLIQVDSLFPNFHSLTEGGNLGLQNIGGNQDNALQNVGGNQGLQNGGQEQGLQTGGKNQNGLQTGGQEQGLQTGGKNQGGLQTGGQEQGAQTGGNNQGGLLAEDGAGDNLPVDLDLTGAKAI